MDIDTNKPSGEEEYRPADYDSSVFDATPTSSTTTSSAPDMGTNKAANIMEHLKRKNILVAVGVLIGIFCVYKIIDVLFSPSLPRPKTTPVVQAQIAKPIQQPTITALPSTENQVATSSIANRLNTLEQQVSNEQTNMDRLSSQMNDLQTAVSNLDSKISTLATSTQAVADVVAKQQASEAAKAVAKKKKAMHAAIPKPVYYVKALVPGRAWLATQDGGTITVSLGNNLPGYGTVEVIDPNQGTLITSTGAIIGYSSGDS